MEKVQNKAIEELIEKYGSIYNVRFENGLFVGEVEN